MRHVFDHTPTAQEVFDQACVFFATSPGPSVVPNKRSGSQHDCAYRGPDGRVCVAGYFLPDEAYVADMDEPELFTDGSDVKSLVKHYRDRIPSWFATHVGLLKELQTIHDNEWNWAAKRWHYANLAPQLANLAQDRGLSSAAVEQVIAKVPVAAENDDELLELLQS